MPQVSRVWPSQGKHRKISQHCSAMLRGSPLNRSRSISNLRATNNLQQPLARAILRIKVASLSSSLSKLIQPNSRQPRLPPLPIILHSPGYLIEHSKAHQRRVDPSTKVCSPSSRLPSSHRMYRILWHNLPNMGDKANFF